MTSCAAVITDRGRQSQRMNSHTVFIPPLLLARAPGNIHRHQRMNSHTVFIRCSYQGYPLSLANSAAELGAAPAWKTTLPENAASESGSLPEEATRP